MSYTPQELHEYSRQWDLIVQEANPKLWKRGVELMKNTGLWDVVVSEPDNVSLTDDEIASEVKARLCGERGEEILRHMQADSIQKNDFHKLLTWQRLEAWLGQFWDFVNTWISKKPLGNAQLTADEVKKVTLQDLVDKTLLDYVAAQEKAAPSRLSLCTTLPTIKGRFRELHEFAKDGNAKMAEQLVGILADPYKFKQLALDHPNAVLLPVVAQKGLSDNAIPTALAEHIRTCTGLPVSYDVYQIEKVRHTGASRIDRFLRVPHFEGQVKEGQEYILVDDHCTMGATLNTLRQYIRQNGGKVVGICALSASPGGSVPEIQPDQLQRLRDNDEAVRLEKAVSAAYGYAQGFEDLTSSQARFLLTDGNADEVLRLLTHPQEQTKKGGHSR